HGAIASSLRSGAVAERAGAGAAGERAARRSVRGDVDAMGAVERAVQPYTAAGDLGADGLRAEWVAVRGAGGRAAVSRRSRAARRAGVGAGAAVRGARSAIE